MFKMWREVSERDVYKTGWNPGIPTKDWDAEIDEDNLIYHSYACYDWLDITYWEYQEERHMNQWQELACNFPPSQVASSSPTGSAGET